MTPTTCTERFSALRQTIERHSRVDGQDRAEAAALINADLREIEAIVKAASDVLEANNGNMKFNARQTLAGLLTRFRRWSA